MADIIVRPTMKFIKAGYVAVGIVIAAGAAAWYVYNPHPLWAPAVFLAMLFWPLSRQIGRQMTKITITDDKLRYEYGLLSKSTRTIQLPKIQDVRVDQRFAQRLFGVGSLSIETAGETSRLTVDDIDMPQAIADEIMARSQRGPGSQVQHV